MRADALRNEVEYLPETVDDLVALRRRIVDAGHPQAVASGIVGWLVAKAAGDVDPTSAGTRSQYRKILAELGPGVPRPGRGAKVVELAAVGADRAAAQNPRFSRSVNFATLAA